MSISANIREWCDEADVDGNACDELRELADRIDRGMMELPKDADGEPICIGDAVWDVDDGMEFTVKSITLYAGGAARVNAVTYGCDAHSSPDFLTHKRPDSWEKLEEDATQQSCEYFGMDRTNASCEGCPHGWEQTGRSCWQNARLDMIARAKKLAGIEEGGAE